MVRRPPTQEAYVGNLERGRLPLRFRSRAAGNLSPVLLLAVVVAIILIVGLVLAPLSAGILVVATLIAIGIVGLAFWGLFFVRSRRGTREVAGG